MLEVCYNKIRSILWQSLYISVIRITHLKRIAVEKFLACKFFHIRNYKWSEKI